MNMDRRNRLQKVIDDLAAIIDEEQEAFDNIPESIQGSERGLTAEQNLDDMNDAKGTLENIL